MVEPTGYTALDLIGFTDKGPYDPTANYVRNDLVHVGNSTWRCKIDDTTGITPTEGANWTIFIESATSLAGMSDVDLNTPKAGDGLVHNGNDWTNIPIMTKEQWKKNGAYNLCPNNVTEQVVSGVTVTKNSDGTLGVANTSSASILLTIASNLFLKAGDYRLTGIPDSSNTEGKYQGIVKYHDGTDLDPAVRDRGSNKALTLIHMPNDGYVDVFLSISASIATNFTYKPMITTDLNATYDDYQPYAKTNIELTKDLDGDAITFTTSTSGISNIFGNGTKIGNVCNVSFYYVGNTNTSTAIGVLSEKPKARTYITGVVTLSDNSTMVGPFVLETNGNVVQQVTNGTIAKAVFNGTYIV